MSSSQLYSVALSAACCCAAQADALRFTNVTTAAGITHVQGPPSDPTSTPEVIGMTGGAAAGDYDGDGAVDAADFTIWRESEGLTGDLLQADGDGDGDVDADDLHLWGVSLGQVAYTIVVESGISAPEPSTLALMLLGFGASCGRPR